MKEIVIHLLIIIDPEVFKKFLTGILYFLPHRDAPQGTVFARFFDI